MLDKNIRRMLLDVIGEIDYDILKGYYMKETAEEPDLVEDNMQLLISIVRHYIKD